MNATWLACEEEALNFDYAEDHQEKTLTKRQNLASMRQLSGRERASRQARYARRSSPTRNSGAHRRGNKRHGL